MSKILGICLMIASLIWFFGYNWIIGFDKNVLFVCALILLIGVGLIFEK